MNEIKCPHCQTVFTIDENSYADIVSQVRNKEFAEDVHKQLEFAKKQFETEKALAKEQEKRLYDEERANFEQKILSLELALKNADVKEEKNVQEALHQKEKEFSALQAELDQLKRIETRKRVTTKRTRSATNGPKRKIRIGITFKERPIRVRVEGKRRSHCVL